MLLNEEAIYANETDALLPSSSNNDDLNDLSYIGRDAIKRRSSRSGSIVMWRTSLRTIIKKKPEVTTAAYLLQSAALGDFGEDEYEDTLGALHARDYENTYVHTKVCRLILQTSLFGNMVHFAASYLPILSFIEPPRWCSKEYNFIEVDTLTCKDFGNMTSVDENGHKFELYPMFGLPILDSRTIFFLETISICILWLSISLRFGLEGSQFITRKSGKMKSIVVALMIGSQMYTYFFGSARNYIAQILRLMAYSIFYSKTLEDLNILIHMLPSIMSIMTVLFLVIVFYSWMGVLMFYESDEGFLHFSDIVEGMWTMWTCVTTSNYPDVMMPSYNDKRVTSIFFVSFMVIAFYFLMNVTLATVYDAYTAEKTNRLFAARRRKSEYIRKAFSILSGNAPTIDRETVLAVFIVLNEDCPDIKYIKAVDAELIFEVLDVNNTNTLDEEEFMSIVDAIFYEFERADSYKTFVAKYLPILYESRSFKNFSDFIKSSVFERGIDLLVFLNVIVCAIQSWNMLSGGVSPRYDFDDYALSLLEDGRIDTIWEVLETLFTVLYVLEMCAKIMVLGWKSYYENARNKFDGFITITSVVASIYVYYPNDYSNSNLIRLIMMARVLRLLRLLNSFRNFQVILETLEVILPDMRMIIGMLLFIMYTFAVIGCQVFGGLITRDPNNFLSKLLVGTDFEANEYWANNFNDMMSGMNVLFNLLIVNNWPEQADGILAVTQSKYSRYFFLFFHIIAVVIVANIVVASIIDNFVNKLKGRDNNSKSQEIDFRNKKFIVKMNSLRDEE